MTDSDQPTSVQEQAWITAANRGDRRAMESLYLEYRSWVFNVALGYCGAEADAHDVVQDVFRYLFGKFPGFTLTCRLKTFLYPAIKNTSLSLIRKRNRMVALDDQDDEPVAPEPRSESADRRDMMDILSDLSEQHREILIARFVDGMKMEEIAEQCRIPQGTVKSRLHHALNKLRKKIKKE